MLQPVTAIPIAEIVSPTINKAVSCPFFSFPSSSGRGSNYELVLHANIACPQITNSP